MCVSVCVSEEGGREGGGGRGADTELKTKTPHVNVGKNASKNMTGRQAIYLTIYLSIYLYLSIYVSIYLSIYLSNLPGRREHAACRSKMPGQTWQGDEWRKPWISNMPSRRCQTGQADVNMQPAGQKCQLKHGRETNGVSHGYQTCQADAVKPARPT